jgi:hypothetical protein
MDGIENNSKDVKAYLSPKNNPGSLHIKPWSLVVIKEYSFALQRYLVSRSAILTELFLSLST